MDFFTISKNILRKLVLSQILYEVSVFQLYLFKMAQSQFRRLSGLRIVKKNTSQRGVSLISLDRTGIFDKGK
ncbi:hypothetical protein EAH81_01775 [Flavobacterium pectinovorum]|uniref:Uncharacterized protein n=1 Tax=Flavobacterium pectinovorum TaxID=29533 RepID=A0A502F7L5_9FLAO|nr:hypothetical protein EAH81_01775 [Flavobacterium pectinovorum]